MPSDCSSNVAIRDVLPALYALVNNADVDAIGLNPAAIHALWTLHGLRVLDGSHPEAAEIATSALGHKSAGVRMNALKVLPRNSAVARSDPDQEGAGRSRRSGQAQCLAGTLGNARIQRAPVKRRPHSC